MQQLIEQYIQSISSKFSHEETSEMGYRADFEILIKGVFDRVGKIHIFHDAKAKDGNKPDFAVSKNDIPILYFEAKDIGVSLDKVEKSEQMARYFGYANLVLTDYVEFRFYRNGIRYEETIIIAEFNNKDRTIIPIPENYQHLTNSLLDFAQSHKEPIKSGKHLAKIMGGKAQRIRDNVRQFLSSESQSNKELIRIYETIKKLLVHDLTKESFADMYAQTLVYGLFVARYHDESPDDFSRREAIELIPKSNPLLRRFFDHIVGSDFDKRLEFIVNELCEVFSHADVHTLMAQYFKKDLWGKTHEGPDPVIHFYEDFLKEYDADLRKKLGAFYTPLPVVRFIVRSVDQILEKEFNLSGGLANTSKLADGRHKVQILDPATGTGTFISATIANIYARLLKTGQKGRWHSYVHNDLLPRLHGFEIMMAPYTIAHLKLSMAFKETGFKHFNNRLGIYLTNSLEQNPAQLDLLTSFGFAESIAEESKEAAKIKNDIPIMVVIGNPPYSVSSSNKGEWIQNLVQDYKKGMNERNIQPLSDDYIKFIRFAEHFIEKNKTGIVAMITNNSFLDGIIHRQMRKHLLETFDDIYIFDLHGNSKKKEIAPDGGKDENVFDIQQGVAISIFVRKSVDKQNLGNVYYSELFGKREDKFQALDESNIDSIKWKRIKFCVPDYFFITKNFEDKDEYEKGVDVNELFQVNNSGVTTSHDNELVSFEDTGSEFDKEYLYRPFDNRHINYDLKKVDRPRYSVMKHMLYDNIGFIAKRGLNQDGTAVCFCADSMIDRRAWSRPGMLGAEQLFPLYLYSEDGTKTPNLKQEIVDQIEKFVGKVSPEDVFDYIYAVLHSPSYREKYKEFLKIDFPRVPYPKDSEQFKKLVRFGKELRELHLMDSSLLDRLITTYSEVGDDKVEKVEFIPVIASETKQSNIDRHGLRPRDDKRIATSTPRDDNLGRVYINANQYFGNISEIAWNFYIGGYQPAQKWLKDRKGRTLTNEEIEHYQKIIIVLVETDRIMKEIDRARFL